MFGIGFPEMILIMALALIVVGPDKLPDLARSLAKGLMELKKTAEGLKESLKDENPLGEIKPDLEDAARKFKENLIDTQTGGNDNSIPYGVNGSVDSQQNTDSINSTTNTLNENSAADAYQELLRHTMGPGETDIERQLSGTQTDVPSPVTTDKETETTSSDTSAAQDAADGVASGQRNTDSSELTNQSKSSN